MFSQRERREIIGSRGRQGRDGRDIICSTGMSGFITTEGRNGDIHVSNGFLEEGGTPNASVIKEFEHAHIGRIIKGKVHLGEVCCDLSVGM